MRITPDVMLNTFETLFFFRAKDPEWNMLSTNPNQAHRCKDMIIYNLHLILILFSGWRLWGRDYWPNSYSLRHSPITTRPQLSTALPKNIELIVNGDIFIGFRFEKKLQLWVEGNWVCFYFLNLYFVQFLIRKCEYCIKISALQFGKSKILIASFEHSNALEKWKNVAAIKLAFSQFICQLKWCQGINRLFIYLQIHLLLLIQQDHRRLVKLYMLFKYIWIQIHDISK